MRKNFAIVGCGRIGNRHAEQIILNGNLVAVCDIIEERALKAAALYNCKAFFSIEDLLKNCTADLISICTPNGLHAAHSIDCLRAGHHVLCEKPLCTNTADGIKMIDAALKADKKIFVVKQNRYNPPVAYLKELLSENRLGEIYSFQVNCFWNRPVNYYVDWKGDKKLDGGTLFTQFSHFIDLIYWLLGDVKAVKPVLRNYAHPNIDFEDTGMVLFEMENKSIGTLNYTVNSCNKNMEGSFTLFAEHGTVKIGGQYLNELEYFEVKGIQQPELPKGNPANGYGFYQGSMSNHDKVYQNLIQALDNPDYPFASAEEGLKTVEIIERIYQS